MAKKSREDQIEDVKAILDEARQKRIELAAKLEQKKEKQDHYSEFQDWWNLNKNSFQKSKDFEQILWLHLKAIKCDTPDKFLQGVENFGLKRV